MKEGDGQSPATEAATVTLEGVTWRRGKLAEFEDCASEDADDRAWGSHGGMVADPELAQALDRIVEVEFKLFAERAASDGLAREGEHLTAELAQAREHIGRMPSDGLVAALAWALDMVDMYDKRLAEIDGHQRVYTAVHEAAKWKSRQTLAKAIAP